MIEYNQRILFVGYGAVAECTLPILFKHLKVLARNVTVMDFEDRKAKLARWTAKGVRFALTEVSIGIMPGGGGTQNLPRAVGERRAKELIFTARAFTAQEGLDWGLVNRVCEPARLLEEALATAQAISEKDRKSTRLNSSHMSESRMPSSA